MIPFLFASEDIRHTKHNLAANPDIYAEDGTLKLNAEICVFCHTPHGGRTDVAGGAAPLWNRRIPPNPDQNGSYYTPYSSPNFDAVDTTNTPGKPKGVSLDCLSCHDGTIGFDALINFPGSGGFFSTNKTGLGFGGDVGKLNFLGNSAIFGGAGDSTSFDEGLRDSTSDGFVNADQFGIPGGSNTGAAPFPNLTTDLSDDHPISIAIPCGLDPQFDEICNGITTKGGRIQGTNSVMWISRDPSGGGEYPLPSDKRDRLRAYPSNAQNFDEPYIECASCHNPHEASGNPNYLSSGGQPPINVDPLSNPGSVNNSLFLRMASFVGADTNIRNRGSLVCLSCHQK